MIANLLAAFERGAAITTYRRRDDAVVYQGDVAKREIERRKRVVEVADEGRDLACGNGGAGVARAFRFPCAKQCTASPRDQKQMPS